MFTRLTNRFASLVAILAIVFASLAPTVSYAFSVKGHHATLSQELCNAQGVKRVVAVDLGLMTKQSPVKSQAEMHFGHCPYCASHLHQVDISTAPLKLFLAEINATKHIQVYAEALPTSFYQVTPPSHAPPAISI